jgi:hypothetical protein
MVNSAKWFYFGFRIVDSKKELPDVIRYLIHETHTSYRIILTGLQRPVFNLQCQSCVFPVLTLLALISASGRLK